MFLADRAASLAKWGEIMELPLLNKHKESLKKLLKEGFIHQPLRHPCGYVGNCYHKVNDKWVRRTHCPQCQEELTWIPLEEAIRRMFEAMP